VYIFASNGGLLKSAHPFIRLCLRLWFFARLISIGILLGWHPAEEFCIFVHMPNKFTLRMLYVRQWLLELSLFQEHASPIPNVVVRWKKTQFDRMVVDHLLRCGFYDSALKLAMESNIVVSWARFFKHFLKIEPFMNTMFAAVFVSGLLIIWYGRTCLRQRRCRSSKQSS